MKTFHNLVAKFRQFIKKEIESKYGPISLERMRENLENMREVTNRSLQAGNKCEEPDIREIFLKIGNASEDELDDVKSELSEIFSDTQSVDSQFSHGN